MAATDQGVEVAELVEGIFRDWDETKRASRPVPT
jgi:hypothetical protein